ncbi:MULTISPECIES: type IV secretory system conjugative DNA transfer family protein [Cysteiniphilum]|uniref:type IV secretory system conjugative DNA transfer family protein n=1 Tax=Cysteiniphilum TaxID=2056696 RepID=UPI00178096CC|nr:MULTISPECIES: type IV secretory system conjugative DNA transfer family protein [Cysteiniphilum]
MIDQPLTLNQLLSLSSDSQIYAQAQKEDIRDKAIIDTALQLGTQEGLRQGSLRINHILKDQQAALDQVYNFNAILLPYHVLPPVLVQVKNQVNTNASQQSISINGQVYKIHAQAHFVTVAPTWRDYLWMNYTHYDLPNRTLWPKNEAEQKLWQLNISKGWRLGMQQADTIFKLNISRLTRDFNGMLLYKQLLANNMINSPYVKTTQQSVKGDGNKLSIHNQKWHLQILPKLQTTAQLWQPVVKLEGN